MPQGFNIGPLTIRFYAIIIIIGAILGAWLAARQAKRAGRDPEIILDMLPWLLIGGIIGARLWHVFTPSASNQAMGVTTENYLRNPIEILKIWKGGLGIAGGVIGGALTLIITAELKSLISLSGLTILPPVFSLDKLLAGGETLLTRKFMVVQLIFPGQSPSTHPTASGIRTGCEIPSTLSLREHPDSSFSRFALVDQSQMAQKVVYRRFVLSLPGALPNLPLLP